MIPRCSFLLMQSSHERQGLSRACFAGWSTLIRHGYGATCGCNICNVHHWIFSHGDEDPWLARSNSNITINFHFLNPFPRPLFSLPSFPLQRLPVSSGNAREGHFHRLKKARRPWNGVWREFGNYSTPRHSGMLQCDEGLRLNFTGLRNEMAVMLYCRLVVP